MNVVRLWTLLATGGFLLSLALVADVVADNRWLHWAHLNGGRSLVARIHLREAILASLVQVCFLAIGWLYLLLPAHRPVFIWLGLTARGWVLVGFLFLAQFLMVADGGLNLWDRRRLLARSAEDESKEKT